MQTVPQTVTFKLTVLYRHIERDSQLPAEITHDVEEFEAMFDIWRKERKRRRRGDRATGAYYTVVLTDHGKAVCEADEYRRRSHEQAVGKFHHIGGYVPLGLCE